MALHGSLGTIRAQAPETEGFAIAWEYLDGLFHPGSPASLRMKGIALNDSVRTELADGVFAIEQAYPTRRRADGFFESHRRFIDVQAIFEGAELIEMADIARMIVKQPYNETRDLVVYEDSAEASLLRVFAGQAAVFFPSDVHMPTLRLGAVAVNVRKSVVKIPVPA